MDYEQLDDSSTDDKDIKPIIAPKCEMGLSPNLSSGPKRWSPGSLQDANRKSAFLPYRQSLCTVLTNLQRGNTQAETPVPQSADINFHTKAGQGEITEHDIDCEKSVDVCDCHGLTALHWAAAYGQYNTVQLLLANGAEIDKMGPEEETALTLAASGGHHDVIRLLIDKGADVNHPDHLCNTPLMYAARGNHPHSCQELLLHGADFRLHNLNGDTAHVIAVENNSTLVVSAQAVITNFIISQLDPGS
ncbi:ankyrin repeat family A protein 2 isoform X1 [Tribolium castaneum]|uniref:ankyrin repeat family A protein 2 isoform X1 n=1 Tax=Tribolium castaneum TaxID=7070 RepID=UPI0030FF18AB